MRHYGQWITQPWTHTAFSSAIHTATGCYSAGVSVHDRWLLLGLTALSCALAVGVALGPLEGIPHVTDEIAYTLQARLLAGGMRMGPAPPEPGLSAFPFWITESATHSPFPVGWPLLLATGEFVGAGWLVNALLACALPGLTWWLSRSWIADIRVARFAAATVALSPGVWVLSASRMSHTSVLVALLLSAACISARRHVWMAGLAVAYVLLARPFDGVFLGGPLLLWGVLRCTAGRERMALVLLPLLGVIGVLLDNHQLTGHPLHFAMNTYLDTVARPGCNRLGFGETVGCHPTLGSLGHSPVKAVQLAVDSARRLDRLLLGLPGGVLLVGWGISRLPRNIRRLMLLWTGLVVGAYLLYWSPGKAFGARFWHPLYVVLPMAIGAALASFNPRIATVLLVGVSLTGGGLIAKDMGNRFWCVDRTLQDQLHAQGIDHGVIFFHGDGLREASWPTMGIEQMMCTPLLEAGDLLHVQDPLHIRGGLQIRFALNDLETTRGYMATHHPGEPAWLVRHDVTTDTPQIMSLGVLAP